MRRKLRRGSEAWNKTGKSYLQGIWRKVWSCNVYTIIFNQISAVDTKGAGDGFCAGFISGHLSGLDPEVAIRQGTKLRSHICLGYGARFGASDSSFETLEV
ncbi:MAG: PfkB family carbohydrate kinase [Candidatus Hodarchaeota archaeon]